MTGVVIKAFTDTLCFYSLLGCANGLWFANNVISDISKTYSDDGTNAICEIWTPNIIRDSF